MARAPPPLGGGGPKRYLSTCLLALGSALIAAVRLANVLKKGVFESHVPHYTAVPTLIIARPTRLRVSAACPGKHLPRPGRSSAGSVMSLVPKGCAPCGICGVLQVRNYGFLDKH
eukprot:356704-Chlamydomonas_euryale.AAC.23